MSDNGSHQGSGLAATPANAATAPVPTSSRSPPARVSPPPPVSTAHRFDDARPSYASVAARPASPLRPVVAATRPVSPPRPVTNVVRPVSPPRTSVSASGGIVQPPSATVNPPVTSGNTTSTDMVRTHGGTMDIDDGIRSSVPTHGGAILTSNMSSSRGKGEVPEVEVMEPPPDGFSKKRWYKTSCVVYMLSTRRSQYHPKDRWRSKQSRKGCHAMVKSIELVCALVSVD